MAYPTPKLDFIFALLGFAVSVSTVEAFFPPYYFQKHSPRTLAPRANGLIVANGTAIALEACINRPQDPTASCVTQIEADISISSLNFCQRRYEEVNACYVFNNNNPSSCTAELLDYQNCGAYTALIYQYCIEYYDYYTEPYLSNCVNTQLQVIPSDNVAATTGSASSPTTISGVSIIPPFTLTSTTTAANPPTTVTNTQSSEPTSTLGATCPGANNTVYIDPNSHAYLIQCSRNLLGYDLDITSAADLPGCIRACNAFVPESSSTSPGSCVGVSFLRTIGAHNCILKYRIADLPTGDPAVDSAQLVVLPTVTITLSSASTGLPLPVTTLPGSTITGQVTTTGAIIYVTTIGTSLVQATTTGLIISTQYGSVSAAPSPSASECLVGKRVRALRQEEMHVKEWINNRLL